MGDAAVRRRHVHRKARLSGDRGSWVASVVPVRTLAHNRIVHRLCLFNRGKRIFGAIVLAGNTKFEPDRFGSKRFQKKCCGHVVMAPMAETRWFYANDDDVIHGPATLELLRNLWLRGELQTDTIVWRLGLTEWLSIGELPSLLSCLNTKDAIHASLLKRSASLKPIAHGPRIVVPQRKAQSLVTTLVPTRSSNQDDDDDDIARSSPLLSAAASEVSVLCPGYIARSLCTARCPATPHAHSTPDGRSFTLDPVAQRLSLIASTQGPTYLWTQDAATGYVLRRVVDRPRPGIATVLGDGEHGIMEDVSVLDAKALVTDATLRRNVDDLATLAAYDTEPTVLHVLQKRFLEGRLHTWVGSSASMLVALHSFGAPPTPPSTTNASGIAPSLAAIAQAAFDALLQDARNQVIIVSGESGAGKTTAATRLLAALTKHHGSMGLGAHAALAAFGHAKTPRNDRSSRFAKLVTLHVDPSTRSVVGASTTCYLLEKARVVRQGTGDSNYLIFYQLLCSQRAADYGLTPFGVGDYAYLTHHVEVDRDTVAFGALDATLDALRAVEILDVDWLLGVVAAILHLGNLVFVSDNETGSNVANSAALLAAATHLRVPSDALRDALCVTVLTIGSKLERQCMPHGPERAASAAAAMAKALYVRLFEYIVTCCNASVGASPDALRLSVLDVVGFESLPLNGLNQLCINYTNEVFQQKMQSEILAADLALYAREGVAAPSMALHDHQIVLDLLDKKPDGILHLLEEQARVMRGSDARLAQQVRALGSPALVAQKSPMLFGVRHYAGVVTYSADGLTEGNKDTTAPSFADFFAQSTLPATFQALFQAAPARTRSPVADFRTQLAALRQDIALLHPRHVCCITPSRTRATATFEPLVVLDQLRAAGVLAAVNLSTTGLAYRVPHAAFFNLYQRLAPGARDCKALLRDLGLRSHAQLGASLVLYDASAYDHLELLRALHRTASVVQVQAVWRRRLAQQYVCAIRAAVKEPATAIEVLRPWQTLFPANLRQQPAPAKATPSEKSSPPVDVAVEPECDEDDENALKQQLTKAVEANDRAAVIGRSIALQKRFLKVHTGMFLPSQLPLLRAKADFANARFYGLSSSGAKEDLVDGMLKFSAKPLHTSLTQLPPAATRDAIRCFKAILGYMGLRRQGTPEELVNELIVKTIAQPELRAEVYAQILKQLTDVPSDSLRDKAWALLIVALAHVPPPPVQESYVAMFIQAHAPSAWVDHLFLMLHQRLVHGARRDVLVPDAIAALLDGFHGPSPSPHPSRLSISAGFLGSTPSTRVLYAFQGNADDATLTVNAGDEVVVLEGALGAPWWFVQFGHVGGYVPATYLALYTKQMQRALLV
ncbi:hypothetical protein, variant [Saprolegnia diclina VS20]|uniref:SH3 domain-containing protein n=1 Tax=Saprolegnia diclina (strain VS20) TaxID=1156394 RepID=T0S0J5_SAPDV|nr:hypothetical protein SDRG_06308 [Saprolegnia diclina VS20]XP_008610304.1 hypothetical protein, variant [Saprolegnia diclina VS20]EQC36197.1 hypothetical protein SDRG_06308 [Saprolegnia diclina VS20]EQC36198.1 hypothetical protein, variant [Saprolegnia diclina VS20]|eukprot:XP_008610303.1 hypothetical protein SDRG_06308 [Saprolegnia diclina VS20]